MTDVREKLGLHPIELLELPERFLQFRVGARRLESGVELASLERHAMPLKRNQDQRRAQNDALVDQRRSKVSDWYLSRKQR